MNVELAEERVLVLQDRFTAEEAQAKAWTKRLDAFGTLARVGGFLSKPKDEDFALVYRERRLQPFWRLVCTASYAYERTREYTVKVPPEVRSAAIFGETRLAVAGEVKFPALETCREELRRETFVDGLSKEARPELEAYLKFEALPAEAADLAALTASGAVLVPPEARGSTVVREAIAGVLGRFDADRVLEEDVRVEAMELYYRPVHAFRYRWQGKEAVLEFDALTGAVKAGGTTFEQYVGKALDPAFLLEVGAEAVGLFVPGATLAKVVIVKGMEMTKRKG